MASYSRSNGEEEGVLGARGRSRRRTVMVLRLGHGSAGDVVRLAA